MGGHSSLGVMFAVDEQGILPNDMSFFDQQTRSIQTILPHKLSTIIHYGCFSRNAGWSQSVAPGGDYFSSEGAVYTTWQDWYDLYHESQGP